MTTREVQIYRSYDEYGPIEVFDDGNKRRLGFGNNDQQSCAFIHEPNHLVYGYNRAMALISIINPKATSALVLGLGAGSLTSFLLQQLPALHIDAVELRAQVIELARRYFQLPKTERLNVHNEDALHFLQSNEPASYDLIFSDIYTSDGLSSLQLQDYYLNMCANCLSDDGWLAINCWAEHRKDKDLRLVLQHNFSQIYNCQTQSGNWILLASNAVKTIKRKDLQATCKYSSIRCGFSFQSVLKTFKALEQ